MLSLLLTPLELLIPEQETQIHCDFPGHRRVLRLPWCHVLASGDRRVQPRQHTNVSNKLNFDALVFEPLPFLEPYLGLSGDGLPVAEQREEGSALVDLDRDRFP